MFLGGGGVIGLKAEKEEEKKKKYFKAIFLQISVHPAFFKKFNFPHRLKISQRYTAKTKYLLDLYLPLAGCMTLRKPLSFSVPQLEERRWG